MTLTEMMNEINALGRSIRAAADRLMADAADNPTTCRTSSASRMPCAT